MDNTIFYRNLKNNPEKLKIYEKAYKQGLIQPFDQELLTKLREIYFSCISGVLYLYCEPTSFETIANKMLILSHAFDNEDYELVHGPTDSTRDIHFFLYKAPHLDFNSWIEIKKGNRTWVYDTFSMLKIDKEVFYKLENPTIERRIKSEQIKAHPSRIEDDFNHISDEWLLVSYIPRYEEECKNNPHKNIIKPEIARFKERVGYDDIVKQYKQETMIFSKK